MATFPFELVAPEKLLFSGPVESVVIPSVEGEMMVLANHAPVMALLKAGLVRVEEGPGSFRRLFVRGGFAEVRPDRLTLLAEFAVPVEELHAEAIASEIRDAEEDVSDATTDEARRAASERLAQLQEVREALGH